MSFEELKPWMEKKASLQHALTLLSFDRSCHRLAKAGENNVKTMTLLNREIISINRNGEVNHLLEECAKDETLSFEEKRIVEEWKKEIDKANIVPVELNLQYRSAVMKASSVWPTYKMNKDWKGFVPYVKEVVRLKKAVAEYSRKEGQSIYDVVLEENLPGFNTEILDAFFSQINEKVVPLLREIAKTKEIDESCLHQEFDPDIQRVYVRKLIGKLGFDFESGDIFESEHPFTTHFHNHDVRFTNNYHPDNLHAVFSSIHETGHALYEMGIRDDLSRTPLGAGTSTPMHEGQSRFYENMIGRNPLFWNSEAVELKKAFPNQLGAVSTEDFCKAINAVHPGTIRIMADELTYSLHILVRYELEKKMMNEEVDYDEFPALWNAKIKEIIGVDVPNDAEGILQDMHWGSGLIGYFPGYSLGSAVAVQLYNALKEKIDIETCIQNQDYATIREYLRENIHQYGKLYSADELLERVTGEKFNPTYYVDYLVEKFKGVYEL